MIKKITTTLIFCSLLFTNNTHPGIWNWLLKNKKPIIGVATLATIGVLSYFGYKKYFNKKNNTTKQNKNQIIAVLKKGNWIKNQPKKENITNYYAKKITIDSNTKIIAITDLHQDKENLKEIVAQLRSKNIIAKTGYKIIRPNTHIVFMGDQIDCHQTSGQKEILNILNQIHLNNPKNVTILMGNHEQYKGKEFAHLPIALYTKNKDTQQTDLYCHGAPEIGYDANPLINSKKQTTYDVICDHAMKKIQNMRSRFLKQIPKEKAIENQKTLPGFLVDYLRKKPNTTSYARGNGPARKIVQSPNLIKKIMVHNKLRRIFRGHQHLASKNDERFADIVNLHKKGYEKIDIAPNKAAYTIAPARSFLNKKYSGHFAFISNNGIKISTI